MDRFVTLVLGGLVAGSLVTSAVPARAEGWHGRWHDIRHDRRDLRIDHRDIHNDRTDLHKDYGALRQDRLTLRNGLKNGASADQIANDRQAIRSQLTDIRGHRTDLFKDRRDFVWDHHRDLGKDLR